MVTEAGERRPLKGVIFDVGFTLLRFEGPRQETLAASHTALVESLRRAGVPLKAAEFARAFRRAMDEYMEERELDRTESTTGEVLRQVLTSHGQPEVPEPILELALEAMYAVSEAHWNAMPGLHPTLEQLRRSGYRLGVISNAGDEANVHRLIAKAEVGAYFDPVFISAALGIRKPDPRPFRMVLDVWGLRAAEVVMVGDTLDADIAGAQNVGMRAIWMRTQADRSDNLAHAGQITPDASADRLQEIPGLIEALSVHQPAG